jgi:hypothetical protein
MNRSSGKRACGNRKKRFKRLTQRSRERACTTHQKKGKNGSPIERKDQGNEDATQ